jgi:hypothetical protein
MSPLGREVLRVGTVEDLCNETCRLPIHLRKRRAAHFRTPPIPDIALRRTLCEQLADKDDSRRIGANITKPPELLRRPYSLAPPLAVRTQCIDQDRQANAVIGSGPRRAGSGEGGVGAVPGDGRRIRLLAAMGGRSAAHAVSRHWRDRRSRRDSRRAAQGRDLLHVRYIILQWISHWSRPRLVHRVVAVRQDKERSDAPPIMPCFSRV